MSEGGGQALLVPFIRRCAPASAVVLPGSVQAARTAEDPAFDTAPTPGRGSAKAPPDACVHRRLDVRQSTGRAREQRPRPGGEILQPRAHRQDDDRPRFASWLAAAVPLTPIAPTASGWSQAIAPLPAWVSATGTPMPRGEVLQLPCRLGIVHAATGDDQWPLLRPRAAPLRRPALPRAAADHRSGTRAARKSRPDSPTPSSARPAAARA